MTCVKSNWRDIYLIRVDWLKMDIDSRGIDPLLVNFEPWLTDACWLKQMWG
jgi:hypothetical protein